MRVDARARSLLDYLTVGGTQTLFGDPGAGMVAPLSCDDATALARGDQARGGVAYHHVVLAPAADERVGPVLPWTAGLMTLLRERKGLRALPWVGVAHPKVSAAGETRDHVHVVIAGWGQGLYGLRPVQLVPEDARALESAGSPRPLRAAVLRAPRERVQERIQEVVR